MPNRNSNLLGTRWVEDLQDTPGSQTEGHYFFQYGFATEMQRAVMVDYLTAFLERIVGDELSVSNINSLSKEHELQLALGLYSDIDEALIGDKADYRSAENYLETYYNVSRCKAYWFQDDNQDDRLLLTKIWVAETLLISGIARHNTAKKYSKKIFAEATAQSHVSSIIANIRKRFNHRLHKNYQPE